jgi:hypothetical protein
MIKKSIKHLQENNMSYTGHFIFAFGHGLRCIKAGIFLIIHSIIPAFFPMSGSKLVFRLSKSFTDHKKFAK